MKKKVNKIKLSKYEIEMEDINDFKRPSKNTLQVIAEIKTGGNGMLIFI